MKVDKFPNLHGLINYEVLFLISAHCEVITCLLRNCMLRNCISFQSGSLVLHHTRIFISSNILCVILSSLNATCSMSAKFDVCHFVLKDVSTLLRSRSSFCDRILTLKFLIVTNDAKFSVHAGISPNEL